MTKAKTKAWRYRHDSEFQEEFGTSPFNLEIGYLPEETYEAKRPSIFNDKNAFNEKVKSVLDPEAD